MLDTPLDYRSLLDKALLERGEAIMVVSRPINGEDATIHTINDAFARVLGRSEALLGKPLSTLRALADVESEWSIFIVALRRLAPIQLELKLRVAGREKWLLFRLAFDEDSEGHANHAMLIGRDVTKARRRESRENESQRLLAAVFTHVSAPVVIVRDDGDVIMSNPAFQRLLGYDADEVHSLNVGKLTAPDFRVAATAARAKQLQDGATYEMRLDTLNKAGNRVAVRLTSMLLHERHDGFDQRMRVVTLIPDHPGRLPAPDPAAPLESYGATGLAVGQVQAVSLSALRAACGPTWDRIAARAFMLAEQIIKRRMGGSDVFTRSDEDGFVIWFDSTNTARNETVLAGIVREIRLRLLMELGSEIAGQVAAVAVDAEPGPYPGLAATAQEAPSPALLDRLSDARRRRVMDARTLLNELRMAQIPDLRAVADRDGNPTQWRLADFPAQLRVRLAALGASLPYEPGRAAEIDMLRLDLAIGHAAGTTSGEHTLVSITWQTLTAPASRRVLDDCITSTEAEIRTRLILLVSGVPALPSAKRWGEIVAPLRRHVGDVAPMVVLAAGDHAAPLETIAAEWPISILALDGADLGSVPPEGYAKIIASARQRRITVLVHPASAAQTRDWRELGATMFVTQL